MKFELELPLPTLKSAATGLSKVIARSGLPVLNSVRVHRDESGQVTLSATDLDSQVTYQVETLHPGAAGTLLVPWDRFSKLVKTTKEKAAFIQESNHQIILRSFLGSMAFEEPIACLDNQEWPTQPEPNGPVMLLSDSFKTAVREALECVSTDSSRQVLNGICLDLNQPDAHYVAATDGRHLYSANSFRFNLERSIIIPNRKFLGWSGFHDDGDWSCKVRIGTESTDSGWIELKSAHWTFGTRLMEGTYPNYRQVIPQDPEHVTQVRFQPEAMALLMETLPCLPTSEKESNSIHLIATKAGFQVKSRANPESPWSDLNVPGAAIHGESRCVSLHRDYFLKAIRNGLSELEIRDSITPVVLRSPGKLMVIAPIRGDAPQPVPVPRPTQITTSETCSSEIEEPAITERKISMTSNTIEERRNIKPVTTAPESSFKALLAQVESIRSDLKETLNALNQTVVLLKAAEREQKGTEKEIESVRATLRSLQKVQL